MDINKTLLNEEFNQWWESVKKTMKSRDRIGSWTEFVKDRWEKESPAVRDEVTKQAQEENATLFKEWKQKAAFAGTPEDLDKYVLKSHVLSHAKQAFLGRGGCQRMSCRHLPMQWRSG
jgi:hypothetical protein